MMAESSSEATATTEILIQHSTEEPPFSTETSKELHVTMTTGQGWTKSNVGIEVHSGSTGSLQKEEKATSPESSSLTPETRTITTEEESELARHIKTGEQEGDPGLDLDLGESSSLAGGSEDQQESTDSASFSIPSLELSDGVTATGNSMDVDMGLSSSYSALGADCPSPSTEVPSLKDDETRGVADGAGPAVSAEPGPSMPAYYLVKWITWKEKKTPIITQSENGPCPLLAIMNTLFLRWKAKLPAQTEVVTTEDLMAHLGECVLSVTPREKADGMELNFQQNMSDAMAVLPKLSTGLDVNVRFTGVTDFEYTPECIVFDLLDIPLYHGWLVDPQSPEMVASVGKLSYNQLVEKIIDFKHSSDSSRVSEGLVAEQFLESTATQLSYHGLCELNTTVKEGEISVFFRNNHFSTMIKHKGHLYLLVTDQGFLQEEGLVWESLHNVEGDGNFCDSDFRLCHPPQRAPPSSTLPPSTQEQQRQIDQDYLVAVSLQQQQGRSPGPLSDLELARQLQQEEYHQQQQQQQQGSVQPTQQVRGQGSQTTRRRDKDSDCVLL
ncbi:ubiquitin carboxyl-terminal hydrolase MINDY-1 [Betta splendens]|uniref:Ubiquitin carboxyl-terminal hydrolase n=1 Tax=Betta splendens TaxID=158456 RepID=A0A6P7NUM1_BETSP|nr:ubiquitin carboxyl-terminal hydrolase MINDY-1 [Betta splendens]XP_029023625.1 ubiquitin carboxyl-terminal hydrolase MINDY-1 [Betta splendens]XP_029023626.1 ubiquitin carboxyl-terminal hydrolase MINDY-1 [Betta splendens]XP_029023627.1 ubiquitin carboxyl-terminal hydrolase MINDY-1 [Betta splendens]XP_029023628.1 ubiquitin carboxyl-terminal hydrolase MINDY-1 [Betta splendens]